MNHIVKIFSVVLISVSMFGCTSYFKRSHTSIKDDMGKPIGTIFVWEADSNAALLNAEGQVCMQNARAVKTRDVGATAKLSDAVLELTKATTNQVTNPKASASNGNKQALVDLGGTIKEAATLLTTTTERTSFLDAGLFYICQLSSNGSLSETGTKSVTDLLIKAASGLNNQSDDSSNK